MERFSPDEETEVPRGYFICPIFQSMRNVPIPHAWCFDLISSHFNMSWKYFYDRTIIKKQIVADDFTVWMNHNLFNMCPIYGLLCSLNFFIGASLVAQTVKNLPAIQETWVQSLGWEDSLEKGMATHCSILAWETPGTEEPGTLPSTGLQELDTTEQLTLSPYFSRDEILLHGPEAP